MNIAAPIEKFICSDNATKCAIKTNGARFCVEMDASKELIPSVWMGNPKNPSSIYQEVIYESLPAFCKHCQMQGHNAKTYKWLNGKKFQLKGKHSA